MDVFEKKRTWERKIEIITDCINHIEQRLSADIYRTNDIPYWTNTVSGLKKTLISMNKDVGYYRDGKYVRYELSNIEYENVNIAIYNEYLDKLIEIEEMQENYKKLQEVYEHLKKTYDTHMSACSCDDNLTEDDFNWDDEDFSFDDEDSEDDNKVIQFPETQGK